MPTLYSICDRRMYEHRALVSWQEKTEVLGEKLVPVPPYPQTPYALVGTWSQAFTVRDQWPTTCMMAWPHKNFNLNTQSLGWQSNFRFSQIQYSNIHHLTTTFSLPNIHIPTAFLTKILHAFPISLSYISRYYNVKALTVQPYVMQSAQKLEAENLDRIASETPCRRTCPTPVIPPAVWYRGNGV